MQVLQGKTEGEMLPTTHSGAGEAVCKGVSPFLPLCCTTASGASLELPQTRGSHGSKGMEAISIQHREGPASLSISKGGDQHAPHRGPGSPLPFMCPRAQQSLAWAHSPWQCWGQQLSSHEWGAWPRRLLADPEVQVIGTSTLGRFDVPTAYYSTGPI